MYLNIMGKSSLLLGAHLHYIKGGSWSWDGWKGSGWASSCHSSGHPGYGGGTMPAGVTMQAGGGGMQMNASMGGTVY
jgi:hypothetical protein